MVVLWSYHQIATVKEQFFSSPKIPSDLQVSTAHFSTQFTAIFGTSFLLDAVYVCPSSNTICNALSTRLFINCWTLIMEELLETLHFLILCCERRHVRRCWIYGQLEVLWKNRTSIRKEQLASVHFFTLKALKLRLRKLNHTGHLSSVSSRPF